MAVNPDDTAPRPGSTDPLLSATLEGLRSRPRRIAPTWFYDDYGSHLFDCICELPEYYLTRTEIAILERHAPEMAAAIGPDACVIEPGSGTSAKTRLLLDALPSPATYVPVDIAGGHLTAAARQLRERHPSLRVLPLCADFTAPLSLPAAARGTRRVIYFPGSTIGNFAVAPATALLASLGRLAGPRGALLLGIDLVKPVQRLLAAYDDAAGVTAAFNLNALRHINRRLHGDFDLGAFRHRALWIEGDARIEMHLVSRRRQIVHLGGSPLRFEAGEAIVSEYSHKYTPASFAALAAAAGWRVTRTWTDDAHDFSVQLLEPSTPHRHH